MRLIEPGIIQGGRTFVKVECKKCGGLMVLQSFFDHFLNFEGWKCLNCGKVIVRKEKKTYGTTGRIAGADVVKGENVLFFDDVVSEGLSKLEGVKPLQELGANVETIVVVVDREQGGKDTLEKFGYKIHALAKISDLVASLLKSKNISEEQASQVLEYIGENSSPKCPPRT